MSRKIKWGIAGLGKIAHKFAGDLNRVSRAELVAVAASDRKRANAFKKEFGAQKAMIPMKICTSTPKLKSFILPVSIKITKQ